MKEGSLALVAASAGTSETRTPATARAVPIQEADDGREQGGDDCEGSSDGDVARWGLVVMFNVASG